MRRRSPRVAALDWVPGFSPPFAIDIHLPLCSLDPSDPVTRRMVKEEDTDASLDFSSCHKHAPSPLQGTNTPSFAPTASHVSAVDETLSPV